MKRIAFRVEDTQEYQDWLRQQNKTSPQAEQALLPDPNEMQAVVNPQGVYEPVTPIRFAATGVGQMAPSSVSPTPANAIARALSSPNVGAVPADPLAKAIDEYSYASAPPGVVTDAIAMLPEGMQAMAGMVAPARADILTGGGSAVGRGVVKTAKAAAKAVDRIAIPVADATGALIAKTLRVVRPKENVDAVARATFDQYAVNGPKMVPIESLSGGVRSNSPEDMRRVETLARAMQGDNGYVERLIVDDAGNVIEGQHRLEALRALGASSVPVVEIADIARDVDLGVVRAAIGATGSWHPDQVNGLAQEALRVWAATGSADKAMQSFAMPPPFDKAFAAALRALDSQRVNTRPRSR
jgi:hypothetical protein